MGPRPPNDEDQMPSQSLPNEESLMKPEQAAATKNDEIPDGGFAAYLQVFGAFLLFVNSWGIVNTYGAYQEYYEEALFKQQTPSAISWIGTLQGFLLFLIGVLCGPIFDRGYIRSLLSTGTFLVVFGMMMTSLCKSYYQALLAQGVCVGLGTGCLFLPSVAIIATYFTSKRAFMTGIINAGGSIGSIIYPIIFRKLQPTLGFAWATRIIAFIALLTLSISLCIMRMRVQPPKKARSLLDLKAFREAEFTIFCFGMFFTFIGLYVPFFYTPVYGTRIVGLSDDASFYLLPAINAGSIFGRLVPGFLADKFGSLNSIIPCGIAGAILLFGWLGITNAPGLWVFSVLYGFFSGAIASLTPTIIALLCPDLSVVGTRMGMNFTFAGLGFLIGNPIAGAILNVPQGKFRGAQAFSAVTILVGAAAFIVVRLLIAKRRSGWKA